MAYCPTCGHEVTETQKFCPECSTKLRGSGAPTGTPPADVSNVVPHRPAGTWLHGDAERDDLDDFFSSYRRKGPAPASDAGRDDEQTFPTRRSRRRFDPDLTYEPTPLPAAPQPAGDGPGAPSGAPQQGPDAAAGAREAAAREAARVDRAQQQAGLDADLEQTRPARPSRAPEPAPVPASPAEGPGLPAWSEERDHRPTSERAPDPFAAATEAGSWGEFSAAGDGRAASPTASEDTLPPTVASPVARPDRAPAPQQAPTPTPQKEPTGAPPVRFSTQRGPFDEVLASHDGPQTVDMPIVARDFERTGIVHVPRLDDGVAPLPRDDRRASDAAASADAASPFAAPATAPGARPGASESPARPEQPASREPRQPERHLPEPARAEPSRGEQAPPEQTSRRDDAGADGLFAEWFGDDEGTAAQRSDGRADDGQGSDGQGSDDRRSDGEPTIAIRRSDLPAPPRVDPAAEAQRPWFEQGLDGTERQGTSGVAPGAAAGLGAASIAGANAAAGPRADRATASAPTYQAPARHDDRAASHDARGAAGAPVDARGASTGPTGSRGPGGHGPGGSGPGGSGGGLGGALSRLDRTGKRRLLTIAIAIAGSILLIISAVIIANVIGARDGDAAADTPTPTETQQATPDETAAEPSTPAAPPPPVADPNFEAVAFQSETGNLRCIITPQIGVACQHSNPAFTVPTTVCTSTGTSGAVVGLDSNGYTFPCLEDDIPYGQDVLPYGESIHAGEFACSMDADTGVSCFNAAGDIIGLEFQSGIGLSGRASVSPQPTSTLPPEA